MSRLPRIVAGTRRGLIWRLVANGTAQGLLAISLAALVGRGLASGSPVSRAPIGALLAAGVLILLLRVVEAGDAERLGQDYVTSVRLRLFQRIAARPLGDSEASLGISMTRLTSDLNALRNWASKGVARGVVATATVLGLLGALAWTDPALAALITAMVALLLLAVAGLTPRIRSRVRESRRWRGRLANNLGEKLLAFGTVRNFGRTRAEARRVRTQSRRLRDALVGRMRAAQIMRSLPGLLLPLAMAAVVLTTGAGTKPARLAASVLLCSMLVAALAELARAWDYRLAFEEGRRRIDHALRSPRVAEPKAGRALPGDTPLAVRLSHGTRAGDGASAPLEAAPGEVVLVCGPSGSGKSRLLARIARLSDAPTGAVHLDGIPLRRISREALASAVQLVAPDLPLLRGTLRDNLAYGLGSEGDDWLAQVASLCGLDDPRLLPEGLDTPVGPRGGNLPPALRARVALARAAATRPRLLLVDDPHFSLDPDAAGALRRVIAALGATTLVVGSEHHPPVAADRVWRLAPARVAGEGVRRAATT